MELWLLGILMDLFVLKKGHAARQERITCASGQEVLIPCEKDVPHTRWFWFPLTSRCANISGESVEITWGPTKRNVTPSRFSRRLVYTSLGSLLLKNVVMSDEGFYVCRLPNGSETLTLLEVTTGCHNNLTVSSQWLNRSSLQLSCRHCQLVNVPRGFYWTLNNSERLGRRSWSQKSHSGAYVTLHPIRPAIWGRWECHSIANPAWVSEICLKEHKREDTEMIFSTLPVYSTGSFLVPSVVSGRHPVNWFEAWIWALLLTGLALVPVSGIVVYFWKREKNKGRKKETDHASVRNPAASSLQQKIRLQQNEELLERESWEETSASIHYAQLQHPPRNSRSIRTPDSTTVYAVVI